MLGEGFLEVSTVRTEPEDFLLNIVLWDAFHLPAEDAVDYALGTTSPLQAERVERHLTSCEACRKSIAELRARKPKPFESPESIKRLAAVIALRNRSRFPSGRREA